MSSGVPPTSASSASCSCGSSNPSSICTCQKDHECKCAPGTCTCPGCPVHLKEEKKDCTCKYDTEPYHDFTDVTQNVNALLGNASVVHALTPTRTRRRRLADAVNHALVLQVNVNAKIVQPNPRRKNLSLAHAAIHAAVLQVNVLVTTVLPNPSKRRANRLSSKD
ncbi:uncharacterized protein IL334_003216 [Kwoniella shivajii]|uniref:Copper-fist domain-containing protein n=1 Tax=Kwoniella shivajii TaxID=564305 RepID=A0ABZ1CWY2_9TREE|nr:hypothetical protein IL334_003216 [Kwoniella shivajii]